MGAFVGRAVGRRKERAEGPMVSRTVGRQEGGRGGCFGRGCGNGGGGG